MIGYKNTISGESSIMQPIRIPENTRNVILVMNLISWTPASRQSSKDIESLTACITSISQAV